MRARVLASALALSASAFIGLVVSEGYTEQAAIPTQNDRPTVGFGSTFNVDGSAVQMGDRTTPVRALITAQAHIGKAEGEFRKTLDGVALSQPEYDVYFDFVYQYGSAAWRSSSMLRNLRTGQYVAACDALLKYRFAGGNDCSVPGNKVCAGVWKRQQERHTQCRAAQ